MNEDIRDMIRNQALKQYMVCDVLEVSESTFIRWLRNTLTAEKRNMILDAIDTAAAEKESIDYCKERASNWIRR